MIKLLSTAGISETFTKNESFWVADIVISTLPILKKYDEWFAVVRLTVLDNKADFILAKDFDFETPINPYYHQHIPYTDHPDGTFKYYVALGTEGYVLMLPSEY
jgi:hypothetical protein